MVVAPGVKKSWEMQVGEVGGTSVRIPITVVNGTLPGPTLCVTAGIHGCEYDSIEAAIRIANNTKPEGLSGALIVLPIINVMSFQQKTAFVNPLDNTNMNRIYPGDPKGSISRRMNHTIFNEVVLKSNFLIDLHGGDLTESIQSHVMVKTTDQPEIDSWSRKLALAFDIKYRWELEVSGIPGYPGYPKGTITYEAPIRGIPSVTAEAGERGKMEEASVRVLYDGIKNCMSLLKMTDSPAFQNSNQKLIRHGAIVSPQTTGLFYPNVQCGDLVKKGDGLAVIKGLDGLVKETMTSPVDGVVLSLTPLMVSNPGDVVLLVVET